jgi:hypothetical protein
VSADRRSDSQRASQPPGDVGEALARARRHGRRAAAEALAALHALLDAGALAASGRPSDALTGLAPLAGLLEDVAAALADEQETPADALVGALAEALDAEIARWEARAADDGEARAVLRAFLGVRELLWEFGVRPPTGKPSPQAGPRKARRRQRVQRVRVQG